MTLINLTANKELKNLGCKWDGKMWTAPKLALKEYSDILQRFYKDLIAVEIAVKEKIKGEDWARGHARTIAGYIIASASGRDSGAEIMDDISVMRGHFSSSGSAKNYYCDHTDDMILRLEVSRHQLTTMDKEVEEGRYTYTIIEESLPSRESLLTEKEQLISRINELDKLLNREEN